MCMHVLIDTITLQGGHKIHKKIFITYSVVLTGQV